MHVNLGLAKGLLISAIPIIISADPTMTLSTIYGAWQFGKFSYGFATDIHKEYKKTNDLKRALLNVTLQRTKKRIFPMLKEFSIKGISEGSAKIIWTYYKETNPSIKISIVWDGYIENAMARTFEEVLNKVV